MEGILSSIILYLNIMSTIMDTLKILGQQKDIIYI